MKIKNQLFMVSMVVTSFLLSCGGYDLKSQSQEQMDANYGGGYESEMVDLSYEEGLTSTNEEATEESAKVVERKLIKNATISFETDSLQKREVIVKRAINTSKGYIEQEENYTTYDRQYTDVTVRVPAENFDQFISAATVGIGDFETKTIKVEDVSEEYVDIAARISTKKALKERFIALLKKAQSIPEIMEVEYEINAIQEEIEAFESRLNYLGRNANFSTIKLSYFVPVEHLTEEEIKENPFGKAFEHGWNGVVLLLIGLTTFWPLIVIAIIVLLMIRFRSKRKQSK